MIRLTKFERIKDKLSRIEGISGVMKYLIEILFSWDKTGGLSDFAVYFNCESSPYKEGQYSTRDETVDTNTTMLIRSSSESTVGANLLGRVNAIPGLKVNQSRNFSGITMFFTAYVLRSSRLFKLKPKFSPTHGLVCMLGDLNHSLGFISCDMFKPEFPLKS